MLTKTQILKAKDIVTETVNVPEWDGDVLVTTLSSKMRDLWEQNLLDSDRNINLSNAKAKLCVLAIVNEKGERLFCDNDIESLGKKSASAISRIYSVASRLNGLSPDDLEELVKNSGQIHSEDSVSD